jgi:hypothetical protein
MSNIIQIWHPVHNIATRDPAIYSDGASNFISAYGYLYHLVSGKLVIKLASVASSRDSRHHRYQIPKQYIRIEYMHFIHRVDSDNYTVHYYDAQLRRWSFICRGLCIKWQ